MHIKKTYSIREMILWTRFETITFIILITVFVALYYFLGLEWMRIPWTPLALIGTAVAFVIGFQNNATYDRLWEARKIWGGIVNSSRTFGMYLQDMITNEHSKSKIPDSQLKEEVKTLVYRHIGWMTALRHSMRATKPWETYANLKTTKEWDAGPPEFETALDDDLKDYISKEDFDYIADKNNKQTALIYLQSHHIRRLKEEGLVWEFSFIELEGLLQEFLALQGKSERIKNFPYPRQFATLNHYFMWIFVLLLPFALVPQFAEIGGEISINHSWLGDLFVWFSIPFYVLIAWIFHTMERIGRTGENPFEGTQNDVPISTIARGIEIDLRQNMGELLKDIPAQFPVKLNTQY